MADFHPLEHGAVGDGVTDDTAALQRTINACAAAGGGTVVIPPGQRFLTGALTLYSRINLHLAGDACLVSSPRVSDFPANILLQARDAEHLTLSGTGTIDGQARAYMLQELPHIYRASPYRPRTVQFENCHDVRIHDLTLKDGANWTLTLAGCTQVDIHRLRIDNDLRVPNCDGIDIENCRQVRIRDCHIVAGDDAVCMKSSKEFAQYGDCEDVEVTGCTLVCTSCAIKIGSGIWTAIRRCRFAHCRIERSNRGLGIQHRDAGIVEDLLFEDLTVETRLFHDDWWGRAEPIYVTRFPREAGLPVGPLRRITFRRIQCTGENGVCIRGDADNQPTDITLEDVQVTVQRTTRHEGGTYDLRPGVRGIIRHRTAGIYAQHVQGLTLRRLQVAWGAPPAPWFGHAVEAHAVTGLALVAVQGTAANPERDAPWCITPEPELESPTADSRQVTT